MYKIILLVLFCKIESSTARLMKSGGKPFFLTNIVLTIPNIVMQPTVEDVQQMLNQVVQCIILVSKGVAQWSKKSKVLKKTKKSKTPQEAAPIPDEDFVVEPESETPKPDALEGTDPEVTEASSVIEPEACEKNYYKAVSENKDIAKFASILSTSISSNKRVRYSLFWVFIV